VAGVGCNRFMELPRRLVSIGTLLLGIVCVVQGQSLADLEAKAKSKTNSYDETLINEQAIREGVEKLIQSDTLQTAEDFRRAGIAEMSGGTRHITAASTSYQLLLTALVMGDLEAGKQMGAAWDTLLMASGRYRRIGAVKMQMRVEKGDSWWVDPAPDLIRQIYRDPDKARKIAIDSKDNVEVKQLVDADQKVRQDWSKLTQKDFIKIAQDDRNRFRRIKEIVGEGGLKTQADFENAALVCQHGEVFLDYALAHELCICALQLGSKKASWLAGASYDRMLRSASYLQPFATQYEGNWHMQPYTNEGVNDRMRKAVVHLDLAQALDREKHPPKF